MNIIEIHRCYFLLAKRERHLASGIAQRCVHEVLNVRDRLTPKRMANICAGTYRALGLRDLDRAA